MKLFTKRLFPSLLAVLVVIWLLAVPAYTQRTLASCRPQIVLPGSTTAFDTGTLTTPKECKDARKLVTTRVQALQQLATVDVVYLGETHDSAKDHQNQLEIIEQLYKQNRKIAIALEMFQRPYQGVVDDYLAGKIDEQQLLAKSEYEQRWGFPWQYYAPIVQFAKAKKLPVLALNTPTEVTRKVASSGLASLSPEERQYIPPASEIRTDNPAYRQLMLSIFQQHQADANGNSPSFERFFLAQVLWDETMAEGIAKFLTANPNYQVVVLVGQGHIVYNYGIPNRVARRISKRQFSQRSVLLSSPEDKQTNNTPIADFIWLDESLQN